MANKKAASSTKKSTVKSSSTQKPSTTTKVTTVKAVESRPVSKSASARTGSTLVAQFTRMPLVAAFIAELVGTFLLTAVIMASMAQAQGQAVVVAFALTGLVLVIGGLSGAHLNPLLTVGAWVTRKVTSVRAIAYLVAQVLGAILALSVLGAFVGQAGEVSQEAAMYGQTAPELLKVAALPQGKEWAILFAELLGTTIFAMAFASAVQAKRERLAAAFTVGFGILTALFVAGYAAAAAGGDAILNPAVAVAVQAFGNMNGNMWPLAVYIATPLVGGVIGFALYDLLRKAEEDVA